MNKFVPIKMVATFVLAIGITVGIWYESVVTYQKVWKEPEEYKITYKKIGDAYEREKFGEEYQKQRELPVGEKTYYITEERVRKVWIVTLKYDKIKEGEISDYSYFVDATTGEIIGGEPWDYFETESDIDKYNYIENGSRLVIK